MLHVRVMQRKPLLRPQHKQSCLRFAEAHLDKPASFWNKLLWTDETTTELFGHNKRRYARRKQNTAVQEQHLLPAVKYGGGSIMLWGCVASAGTHGFHSVSPDSGDQCPGISDKAEAALRLDLSTRQRPETLLKIH
uniref:Transposase Tc1-like domain-containing protein n=1 Tax=Astatotilapia calliptera TaxID=8154 RepID=A0AAX7TAP6_ASTCA